MRLYTRAFRRADLPVVFSQGYNPRLRLSFPLALSLGVASLDEIADIQLDRRVAPDRLYHRLAPQVPAGLAPHTVECLPAGAKSKVTAVTYRVPLPSDWRLTQADLDELLENSELPVQRVSPKKRRTVDIRPYLIGLRLDSGHLIEDIRVTPNGTARPEEPLLALGRPHDQLPPLITKTATTAEPEPEIAWHPPNHLQD
jgi:radical SAM-linked protein